MAGETGAVWAIDIGNNSLKALYLSTERGVVEVLGFDNIQHGKVLSGGTVTEAEKEELIAISLRKLVTKYDLTMDDIVVSVPSQNSFTRFVNLPPVEAKKIPEMVQFEAVQQIPFGINDVQWDWQLMSEPNSPEIKVGIFAIKNEIINTALNPLNREDIEVSYVQIAPMALYNYLLYDRPELVSSDNQAAVVLNIGADNTDLVVCTKSSVWQRCILLGGNSFTKAIAETFKLNFDKAEKLKRTAPVSKYARQIFQAMRPVFNDLASEVQRSIGFYNSSNPNTKIVRIIALGGGTKLRGLKKYLEQTLQLPVERPDSFKKLAMGSNVSQAKFHENVFDFGIVYGLALQGLGLAKIESNLLPKTIARSREWASKGRYFITAACLLLAVSLLSFARAGWDKLNYDKENNTRRRIQSTIDKAKTASDELEDIENERLNLNTIIDKEFDIFSYREIIPQLYEIIFSALPNEENTPAQANLYKAFQNGNIKEIKKISRSDRKQMFLTNIDIKYTNDLENAVFGEPESYERSASAATGDYDAQRSRDERERADLERRAQEQLRARSGYGTEEETVETTPGFVVTIVGYTPYGKPFEIIDPDVKSPSDEWGFLTRLDNLDEFTDSNSPFELFNKRDSKHCDVEVKEIDLNVGFPPIGIGVDDTRTVNKGDSKNSEVVENILIDPLTKEIICKVAKLDENGEEKFYMGKTEYQTNDYWFIINLKFVWEDAPLPPENSSSSY